MIPSNDPRTTPRPWWQIVFAGVFLGACLALVLAQHAMTELTQPIEIWVDAEGPGLQVMGAMVHDDMVVESGMLDQRWPTGPYGGVASRRLPYTGIVLIGAPAALDQIERVTLRMGKHSSVFGPTELQSKWMRWAGQLPEGAPPGSEARVYQTPISPCESRIAFFNDAINYEGDAALARHVLLNPIFVVCVLSFVLLLLLRAFIVGSSVEAAAVAPIGSASTEVERFTWIWLLAGLAALIGAGCLLEREHPYYFSQDDNLAQFLPNILYGCEALGAGVFPSWNPYQYLGAPLAEIGTYALTYPGTYFSYWVAAEILGDRYATIEVFCCLHLLLGYLALFWLGRRLGLAGPLASAFGLCQVLSGFALVVGRSWYYMTPVYVWVPLLFIALLQVRTRPPTWRWTLATGVVIGLFFHAGNAQMWIYGMSLAGLFVLGSCVNRSMPWSRLVQMVSAALIGLGIAAVLLVPQFMATRALQRNGGEGWDISEGVLSVFAPYPTPVVVDPANQQTLADSDRFGTMYHAGSVFTIAWLLVLLLVLARRGAALRILRNPWLALAALTFLLALGKWGGLWTLQAKLPVFNQFNHPHKFLPFFHLFSCVVGAMFVNRAIRLTPWPRCWQTATFVGIAFIVLHHAFQTRSALFVYADAPYPALPSELAGLKRPDVRILPLTFVRSGSPNYVLGLQHNFPTVYGISSIGGYDPLLEQGAPYRTVLAELHAEPRSAICKHGVTHLVLHEEVALALKKRDWAADQWRKLPVSFNALVVDCAKATPVMQSDHVRVYAVKNMDPMLPKQIVPCGVDVDVSSLTSPPNISLSYLWRPGARVYADGTSIPTNADADLNVCAAVPRGARRLELRYESPWRMGLVIGAVLVGVGLAGAWISTAARRGAKAK